MRLSRKELDEGRPRIQRYEKWTVLLKGNSHESLMGLKRVILSDLHLQR